MDEIKVAFLDDGLNMSLLSEMEKVDLYAVEDGEVILCSNINRGHEITHGTICVKIFKQFVKIKANIISIEILDYNKRCSSDKLVVALNWIEQMGIKIVNLSLGTSFFGDEMCLKRCVNKLADSGHIIVAAQNNNSFITYPATFTNVIGVSASHENQDILLNTEYVFSGIDLLGKSEHEIDMQGNKIVTQHASSFATPYITAMVANLYKPGDDVLDMKHKLCSTFCDGFLELKKYDWCNKAIIVQSRNCNFEKDYVCFEVIKRYYFDEIEFKIEEIKILYKQNIIKTLIIIGNGENIIHLLKGEKVRFPYLLMINTNNEILLSKMNNLERTLIIKDLNLKKIFSNEKIKKLDIPIVVIYYNEQKENEAICRICKAKEDFTDNGYNCKTFIDKSVGVLYSFEYWAGEFDIREYIEFYMIDLVVILINMNKKNGYIDGDLNLRFGQSEVFSEINMLFDVEDKDIYQYTVEQLQEENNKYE